MFDGNNVPCNCRSSTVFLIVRCVVSEITEECAHLLRFFTGVELHAFINTLHLVMEYWIESRHHDAYSVEQISESKILRSEFKELKNGLN